MSKFYIQSGYQGKEVGALLFSFPKERFKYSKLHEYENDIPVGSVEFVEGLIGVKEPDYYPRFLSPYFNRRIWYSESWPKEKCFIKPADRHKRFDSQILENLRYPRGFGGGSPIGIYAGPYWCSEIVKFTNEWRYYVANGNVLAAHWYQGEEETEAPYLDIMYPPDFCGAVDFGVCNGQITLVENNLPYACGWYGPYEGRVYGEWLEKGWEYLLTYKNKNV